MAERLHRIEALPRADEYLVTLRDDAVGETSLVMTVKAGTATAPQATLPARWTPDTEPLRAVVSAVLAMDAARRTGPQTCYASDVPGGWDVSLGNVTLAAVGGLTCVAHGAMGELGDGLFECVECGSRGLLISSTDNAR